MVSLSLSATVGVVNWTISGLSNPFTSANYMSAGITNTPVTSGSSTISGCMDEVTSGAGGTSVSDSFSSYSGTYTFYAFARSENGLFYPAGSASVTVPSNSFSWDIAKYAGSSTITATEWNNLITFITNKVGSFSVNYAYSGNSLSATMYNQLINGMGASSYYLVSVGQAITADNLNLLVTLANNL